MSDDTTETETTNRPKATGSVAEWTEKRIHKGVTLPSGTVVDLTLPDLPELARAGDIPNELLAVAQKLQGAIEADAPIIDVDTLANVAGFSEYIVPLMLVAPTVEAQDVAKLPIEDKEMLLAFSARRRDIDAVGRHLSGLETQADWRKFREFDLAAASVGG